MTMSDQEHDKLLDHARRVGRDLGIDKTLNEYDIDVIIAPADSPVNLLVSAAGTPTRARMSLVFPRNGLTNQVIRPQQCLYLTLTLTAGQPA